MTKLELNRIIAEKVLGMELCNFWEHKYYPGMGAVMFKRCHHADNMCYPARRAPTVMGWCGGPPEFSNSSRAGLVLLQELEKRNHNIALIGFHKVWTAQIDNGINIISISASGPEMAIALLAVSLAGYNISEDEITD